MKVIDGFILIKYIENVVSDAGLDFERVCKRAGVSDRDLYRYLNGERWPSISTITKINRAFLEENQLIYASEPGFHNTPETPSPSAS